MLWPLPGIAAGQALDLAGPDAPPAGRGLAALALASRLDSDASRFDDRADDTSLDGLRSGARAALRRAAATLAQLGETLGPDGSEEIVHAMTIDARLDELDRLIEASEDPALLAALRHDFEALGRGWSRGVSVDGATLDRQLASALAVLALESGTRARSGAGWFDESPPVADADADAVRARIDPLVVAGLSAEAASALGTLADQIEAAAAWPSESRRIAVRARLLTDAADALLGLPAWTGEAAARRMIDDFAVGVVDAEEDTLLLLVAQRDVLDALDAMEPGRESDRLRARAAEAIASRTATASASALATSLAARALGLSVSRPAVRQDSGVPRVLRPAWRALVPRVREVTVSARDAAVNLLLDPSDATDPGVLATLAAQRRLFDDFLIVERIGASIEEGLGGDAALDRALEDRLLALGQDMQQDTGGEDALALLRRFAHELETLAQIERDAPAARRVMGDRGADLPIRIGSLRDAWLRGWAVAGGTGADAATVEDLEVVSRLVAMLADAEAFTRLEAIDAWPGVELTPLSTAALARGLTPAIDEVTPDAMRAGNAIARQRALAGIALTRGNFAGALLVGRLSRLGEQAGLTIAEALEELALGAPTGEAWMAGARAELADVSRYAEELGRIETERSADDAEAAQLRTLVSWRALRLLERIESVREP